MNPQLLATAPPDLAALRARIAGDVYAPGEPGWDEARLAWNLAVDQHPAAVGVVETAADVVATIAYARAAGLRVTAQGTGHYAATYDTLADTILVKTHRMRGVEVDAERRVARVEAGVIWQQVAEAAAPHGLAGLAGSAPDVGVVGYSLGGGIGWLARKHGLAADGILAAELVTADGELVRADAESHPDLFWALRGGGGSFGIVTALEIRLLPVADVYAGVLFYPIRRAGEVLRAWRRWTTSAPEEATSAGRIMQFPPLPEVPEFLRGRSFALVEVAYMGSDEAGDELVRPLRALGPTFDTIGRLPAQQLANLHMDPPHPVPGAGDGMMLDGVTDEAIDALVAVAGTGSDSPLLSVELRQLGGALGRRLPTAGALGSLEGDFALFGVGIAATPETAVAVDAHVERVKAAMEPWEALTGYHNFSEHSGDAEEYFPPTIYRRLREVKARYDRTDVIRGAHPVPPAA